LNLTDFREKIKFDGFNADLKDWEFLRLPSEQVRTSQIPDWEIGRPPDFRRQGCVIKLDGTKECP